MVVAPQNEGDWFIRIGEQERLAGGTALRIVYGCAVLGEIGAGGGVSDYDAKAVMSAFPD
jgi:hypothetical protein